MCRLINVCERSNCVRYWHMCLQTADLFGKMSHLPKTKKSIYTWNTIEFLRVTQKRQMRFAEKEHSSAYFNQRKKNEIKMQLKQTEIVCFRMK